MADDIYDLSDKALRARRLASETPDPAVRMSLLEIAAEHEARVAEFVRPDARSREQRLRQSDIV